MFEFWQTNVLAPLRAFWEQGQALLPHLIQSLLTILIGFVLAWLLGALLHRGLALLKFDRLAARLGVAEALTRVGGARSPSRVAGQLAYWFVVVLALLAGLDALDTDVSRDLVGRFFGYLPHLFVAGLILLLGAIISRFLARSVLLAAVNAQVAAAPLMAGGVRFLVMVLAAVAALEHLGIGRGTLLVAFGIVFGGVVLALAIAFGLGGRDLAREMLEQRLRKRTEGETEAESVHHL
ncbi:MAG: hypothetical protein ACE5HB_01805 [Terriglobia bacterium]